MACPCCGGCCCVNGVMNKSIKTLAGCNAVNGIFYPASRCGDLPTCSPSCQARHYCNYGTCVKADVIVSYCGLSVSNTAASGPDNETNSFDEGGTFGGYTYGNATDGNGLILNPGYKLYQLCNDWCVEVFVYIAIDFVSRTYLCRSCFYSSSTETVLVDQSTSDSGRQLPCAEAPSLVVNWAP